MLPLEIKNRNGRFWNVLLKRDKELRPHRSIARSRLFQRL